MRAGPAGGMDITDTAVKELVRAGLPTSTIGVVGGRRVRIKMRMGQMRDQPTPTPWTNFQDRHFRRWWAQTGKHLGLSQTKYDLHTLYVAGFRGFSKDGAPLFRRHDGRMREGRRTELDLFRVRW